MCLKDHKCHVLLSRSLEHASAFAALHQSENFHIDGVPLITFEYVEPTKQIQNEAQIKQHDWLVITSHNGIHYFFEWLTRQNISKHVLEELRIVTVGEKTRQTLASYGYEADFVPEVYDAETLAYELIHTIDAQYPLLIKGTKSREVIGEALTTVGIPFRSLVVYNTSTNWSELNRIQYLTDKSTFDAYVFTSPSTIDAFLEMVGPLKEESAKTPCFAIGQTTANHAQHVGFQYIYIPNTYTLEALAEYIQYFFKE